MPKVIKPSWRSNSIEKQRRMRNGGEKEAGQPSRKSGQTDPEPKEHTIDIDKWIDSVKKAKKRTRSQTQWSRIPKVPEMLRGTEDFKKFFEPRVISIGPYHHDKHDLKPGEMIKPLYAKKFLAESNQDIKALYIKIKSKIKEVRNCYDWSSTKEYDDEALARMMLMDGCFLLQFIRGGMRKVLRKHQRCFVKLDSFLLENQLPYGVLKLILERAKLIDDSPMEEQIKNFVNRYIGRPEGSISKIQLEEVNEEPSHLLDLLRSAFLGKYKKIKGNQPEQEQEAEEKAKSLSSGGGDGEFCCPWKKGKLRRSSLSSEGDGGSQPEQEQQAEKKGESSLSFGGGDRGSQPEQEQQAEKKRKAVVVVNRQSFRRIKELKAAGIYLRPSGTSCVTEISFNSYFFYGYLNLPPIIIDDFTKPKFLNILAYEMCPDAPDDYAVTSYICFLDNLIDHEDDVKELRSFLAAMKMWSIFSTRSPMTW